MGKRMSPESIEALNDLAAEKGIDMETLLAALADAIETGYRSQPGAQENAWVTIDPAQMEIRVLTQELSDEGVPIGEEEDITPEGFGRVATHSIRQVLSQGIKEVEWKKKYEEYAGREGEVVTGIVKQSDARFTLLDLGSVEALLPLSEQVPSERLETGTRLKAYIVEVRLTTKGPPVVVSRTHPGLIKRLFEMEVPEISDGIVEVLACAREPGRRTKIAVYSNDGNVDPVGACVGARGVRVHPIVNELMGEKIDIIPYVNDPSEFVSSALSPAKVQEVKIDHERNAAEVSTPDDKQLSLAIGKDGQNARLAARLTGYIIYINNANEAEESAGARSIDSADNGTTEAKEAGTAQEVQEDAEKSEEPGEKTVQPERAAEEKPEESGDAAAKQAVAAKQDDSAEQADAAAAAAKQDVAAEKDVEQETAEEDEQEWAGGEWITDPETGQQAFYPADGSDPIMLEDWEKQAGMQENSNENDQNVTDSQENQAS